jgi:AcrR family transcriptional regulator
MSTPAVRPLRRDAERNRRRILEAAAEAFAERGLGITMDDIADHAGVGVGTVYRHFASREDLLGALVHRSFALAVANARAATAEPGSALDGVRSFLTATLRDRDRFVLPLHGGPVVFDAAIRELQAEVREVLQALLDRGQTAGELRADLTPVDVILSASLLSRPLPAVDDWDLHARRQIELLLHGLQGPESKPD